MTKETKPRGSNAHPAKSPKPMTLRPPGDDGFAANVGPGLMRRRLFALRDNPNVAERITHESRGLVKLKPL
jgi:hypothetical protein